MHGTICREVGVNHPTHLVLADSRGKGQAILKGYQQSAVATRTHRGIMTLCTAASHRHRHLGGYRLFPDKSFGAAISLSHRMRVMDGVVSLP